MSRALTLIAAIACSLVLTGCRVSQSAGAGTSGVDVGLLTGAKAAHPSLVVRVAVRHDRVIGGEQTVDVQLGSVVQVIVQTDRSDEFHLHGYNIERQARPGAPATFVFRAVIPGEFDGELHLSHVDALRLRIQ